MNRHAYFIVLSSALAVATVLLAVPAGRDCYLPQPGCERECRDDSDELLQYSSKVVDPVNYMTCSGKALGKTCTEFTEAGELTLGKCGTVRYYEHK